MFTLRCLGAEARGLLVTGLGRHGEAVTGGRPRGAAGNHILHRQSVVASNRFP